MEDLVGRPASLEVTGVVKSYSIEDESEVIRDMRGDVMTRTSTLRKKVVIETFDGGEATVDTIGPVKIVPLVD